MEVTKVIKVTKVTRVTRVPKVRWICPEPCALCPVPYS